jgi:hypothetical protein
MGRKPADREGQKTVPLGSTQGFEASIPCRCCGAASRAGRSQWRVCANGHTFVRKSDDRAQAGG